MSALTEQRRVIFYDAEGTAFQPVRHGDSATGRSVFQIKPKGASNRASEAIQTEDILVVASAMLVDGLAARCKALTGGNVNYLRFGAEKLVRYEIGPEVAQALGIPESGTASSLGSVVNRNAVEAAMDAYDAYLSEELHKEIFGAFGEPRDYWVRSTRKRERSVYPTKPLIGFILKKTELNGGWAQKDDAAAKLHNAGYVVVDHSNVPIEPPDRYEHLMSGADRIRLCALNYFIEPAREAGASEASIRAGDFSNALGLRDVLPNICQALGGERFQLLARVPPPVHTGPNPGSTTVFTYMLQPRSKEVSVPENTRATSPIATNLILYGPPGTGKTYHTVWEAVRLCLGDAEAAALQGKNNRLALMSRYRELVSEGRIEFVTFHQSMSYEEFVEGLRPETGGGAAEDVPTDTVSSAGFRLDVVPGIFKNICEAASRAPRDAAQARLEPGRSIFKLAINGEDPTRLNKLAVDSGLIFWTWGGDIDWSPDRYSDFNEVKNKWLENNADSNGYKADIAGTFCFRSVLEIGDYVVLTRGRDQFIALGRVTGEYKFQPEAELPPHRRSVDWLWKDLDNAKDRAGYFDRGFNLFKPISELVEMQLDRDALNKLLPKNADESSERTGPPHVLIIDEINRANISKVFGELITLLEPDKRLGADQEIRVTLPYSKRRFGVPANLHIIGTMNTADRSIALLDTALRRRFTFRELMPDPLVLPSDLDGINLQRLLRTLNSRIEYLFDRDHQIGHAYFTPCETRGDVEDVMRHKVIPLLAEYFYEDWSKVAAVLGDTKPGQSSFLEREEIEAPAGMDSEAFSGPQFRWRLKPERTAEGRHGFDFSEFQA